MTTQTTTRTRRDDSIEARYIVEGPRGAVEYHAISLGGQPLGIEYHARDPRWEGDKRYLCSVLARGRCYPDGTSVGAADLHREYADAGYDEEVIWAELERRYAKWEAEDWPR